MYDVIIIGAGVTGSAVARELSKYDANICVLEACEDVCEGTSKANSAIIHAGFDAKEGTLMAKMNVRGNQMMDQLAEDLDIPFKRNGALVVCTDREELEGLTTLYERGIANGVEGLRILTRDEALEMEPNLSDQVEGALYAPTSGIICPFILNIAMAENAFQNGVDFFFNTRVEDIRCDENGIYHLRTGNGEYQARYVVNAAGVYADELHNLVSSHKISITPRRGDYCLLDKDAGSHVSHTIFSQPTKKGKGVLVSPTVHGNLIVGPTAIDIEDKEGVNTTAEGISTLISKAGNTVKNLPMRKVITSFAGLRAHEDGHEFILGEVEDAPHFIDCAGIESPGLSSCPAIGEYIASLLKEKMGLEEKEHWNPKRKGILNPETLSIEERNALIQSEPAYGQIVCRCESISEGEILDAIRRPLGARSLDGVKRRVRAGMGRCQAGFCSPKVMELLHSELGLPLEAITKSGGNSHIVLERTKGADGGNL
ncbi:MAG: NAD(P)/FAD-dependent oxidoreductase [Solobacterium sp.]|nr:NAD(P)/FAD-dependent oxidoreductase [Solobacterium sp.]